MSNFFKNYLSTILFILIIFFWYYFSNFNNWFFIKNFSFEFIAFSINSINIYIWIILSYIILLIPFYNFSTWKSKARIVINYIINKTKNFKYKITSEEKISILAWCVKMFFAPLMIIWLTGHIFTMFNNIYLSFNDLYLIKESFLTFFNKHFFWLFFTIILFFDVLFFTLGYLIESPKFNNKIRSVEATFLWWFVVLLCYPPLNTYTIKIIWWYSRDFPQFTNNYLHILLNIFILIFMWIYSRASVSLWLKASNLTNRWIVKKWPYKYIRHPAYVSKNTAWWIGGTPLLFWNLINGDFKNFFIVLMSLLTWSFIYYLRAITEEKHLSLDPNYIKYKQEVKYKFIPKIF